MRLGSEYSSQGYGMQSDYNSCNYNNGSSMQMMPNYRYPDYPKPQTYTDNYYAYSRPTMHNQYQESSYPNHGYDSNTNYSSSGYGSKPAGMHGGNTSHVVPLSYHEPMHINGESYERETLCNGYGRGYNYERTNMQNPGSGIQVVRKGIESDD